MRNPYIFNISWLTAIGIVVSSIIWGPCLDSSLCFSLSQRIENIFLGILSSAILLILTEIINFLIDKRKYGFLKKKYLKQTITQVNAGRERSDFILNQEQHEIEYGRKYIRDSIHHELVYYNCSNTQYVTELKYHYHGIYTGTVEYLDHNKSDWKNGKITKTKAFITLNLNLANKMTGSGSYKYQDRDDFGKFEFQVADNNAEKIIVSYINTIPSGLAEGYEIWA